MLGYKPSFTGIVAVIVIIILLLCAGYIEVHAGQGTTAEWNEFRRCQQLQKERNLAIQRYKGRINNFNRNPNVPRMPSNLQPLRCTVPGSTKNVNTKKKYRMVGRGTK